MIRLPVGFHDDVPAADYHAGEAGGEAASPADYSFWRAQLAGENPETTPGTPHAGFYRGGSSGAAYKQARPQSYVAIWQRADGEWIARTDYLDGRSNITEGWAVDEFVFPRVCRNAVSYEEYIAHVGQRQELSGSGDDGAETCARMEEEQP